MDAPAERGAPSQPPSILLDTAVLILARILYYALSRRYLLASLSPTLRDLQKSDIPPLPTTATCARARSGSTVSTGGSSIRTGPRTPQAPAAQLPDTEDEDTDTPASSYPGSPISSRFLLPGERTPTGSAAPIEMALLGAKLRDTERSQAGPSVSGGATRVIELAHAAPLPSAVGTRRVKRAARGLSRVARFVKAATRRPRLTAESSSQSASQNP